MKHKQLEYDSCDDIRLQWVSRHESLRMHCFLVAKQTDRLAHAWLPPALVPWPLVLIHSFRPLGFKVCFLLSHALALSPPLSPRLVPSICVPLKAGPICLFPHLSPAFVPTICVPSRLASNVCPPSCPRMLSQRLSSSQDFSYLQSYLRCVHIPYICKQSLQVHKEA